MRNTRLQLAAALATGIAGIPSEAFRQTAAIEAITAPSFGPQQNKYKPHQGMREMQRRAKQMKAKS